MYRSRRKNNNKTIRQQREDRRIVYVIGTCIYMYTSSQIGLSILRDLYHVV